MSLPPSTQQTISMLLAPLTPVLAITGLSEGDYACHRCTQRRERQQRSTPDAPPIRHQVMAFNLLPTPLWASPQPGYGYVYLLAVESGNACIPRYAGWTKAIHLRHHWTRSPRAVSASAPTTSIAHGSVLHHQPFVLDRMQHELRQMAALTESTGPAAGPGAQARDLQTSLTAPMLKLYGQSIAQLWELGREQRVGASTSVPLWCPPAPPATEPEHWNLARRWEQATVVAMNALQLAPWNQRGPILATPELFGPTVFTQQRFHRHAH